MWARISNGVVVELINDVEINGKSVKIKDRFSAEVCASLIQATLDVVEGCLFDGFVFTRQSESEND